MLLTEPDMWIRHQRLGLAILRAVAHSCSLRRPSLPSLLHAMSKDLRGV